MKRQRLTWRRTPDTGIGIEIWEEGAEAWKFMMRGLPFNPGDEGMVIETASYLGSDTMKRDLDEIYGEGNWEVVGPK